MSKMATRYFAASILLLLLVRIPLRCSAQENKLVVTADVFEKLKALFATKEENYISRQGKPLHAMQLIPCGCLLLL
jgi:hypothetical protein